MISFFAELWPQILINLGVSAIVPLILYSREVLDEPQSILFGALLTIISTTIEVLWYVKKIANRERIEREAFSLKSDFSRRLAIIQQAFGNIVDKRYGEKDLFLQHYSGLVSELETQISKSDTTNELVTDRGHFSNINFVLDAFKGDSQDSIRAVHFLKHNVSFFENISEIQFYAIYKLVPEKIVNVKRLIVFTTDDECRLPTSNKIIRFHSSTTGYSCKIIGTDPYYELQKLELHDDPDFVIYGDRYIFFPQHQSQEGLQVRWSKDKETIQRYILFFENTWGSKFASEIDEQPLKQPISLDDLFNPAA